MSRFDGKEQIKPPRRKRHHGNIEINDGIHRHRDVDFGHYKSPEASFARKTAVQTDEQEQGFNLSLDGGSLLNAIVISEILGKPKFAEIYGRSNFLRRGRRGF